MLINYFKIKNFKGIVDATVNLASSPKGNVFTLVGLNESGKTTVLEAMHFLTLQNEDLEPLDIPGYTVTDVHDLIPISKRSNFNETISVEAGIELDENEKKGLVQALYGDAGFIVTKEISFSSIKQSYKFIDSKVADDQPERIWSIQIHGKKKGGRRERYINHQDSEWAVVAKYIRSILPSILYFPNFLFEFPDRIYLEETPPDSDVRKHKFYCAVLQDVLDVIGTGLNLNKHILERAKSGDKHDLRALDSVLLEMGGNISATVISRWNQIFKQQQIGKKEIVVAWDTDEENRVYLQLKLKDGIEQYAISERSLGFRWFFAFLLFTQYRGSRKGANQNVLFLLDEPASNLHPSAQAQLLESFGHFPETSSIIYTTHSHHMIDPAWLENTYVVRNEGLNYDVSNDNYSASKTVITLERYRNFAVSHPDQRTYFQPILDVLDYCPSRLENVPDVVMVEGKNDFYTLQYFSEKVLKTKKRLNLMPGGGSGSLDAMIRLYLAWGRRFIVLLDSDVAGLRERQRYENLFGALVKDRVYTYEDIDASWINKPLEKIFSAQDCQVIQTSSYPDGGSFVFDKTQFNRAIQELYLIDHIPAITQDTKDNVSKILRFLSEKMQAIKS